MKKEIVSVAKKANTETQKKIEKRPRNPFLVVGCVTDSLSH